MGVKDHSNPLSRPYSVRLAEQGFLYNVKMPSSIEPYTLDDVHLWMNERGYRVKKDYIISSWSVYMKDQNLSTMFALRWA